MKRILLTIVLALALAIPATADDTNYQHHESALSAGAEAPMFILPDGAGNDIELKKVLKNGPALVFFYRGNWCGYCTHYMKGLAEAMPEIKEMGATVIAVSPQLPKYSAEQSEKMKGAYLVASDENLEVAKAFGIDFKIDAETQKAYKHYNINLAEFNGNEDWEMNVPGYFVINTDGTIAWAYANKDYKVRPDAEMLISELKKAK
jgi:peroxiredoxin